MIYPKPYKNKKTGQYKKQIPILEMAHYEEDMSLTLRINNYLEQVGTCPVIKNWAYIKRDPVDVLKYFIKGENGLTIII